MTPPTPPLFDALMSEGMAASQAGDGAHAIDCFRQASAAAPDSGLPQFLLGAEFAALGDVAQAEAAFANATRLAPDFPVARYQLGLLQFSSGRPALALLTWQPLLALAQTDPLVHFVQGFAALAGDRLDDALRHYRQGLALDTTNKALFGDIEKVIAGIEALAREPDASPGPLARTPPEPRPESEAQRLLANYRQQGPLH